MAKGLGRNHDIDVHHLVTVVQQLTDRCLARLFATPVTIPLLISYVPSGETRDLVRDIRPFQHLDLVGGQFERQRRDRIGEVFWF
jgi:hypothetical protein